MAEPTGADAALDGRLRDALARAAEHGNSTGVADALRARVAAGDPGTPAQGPVAPGWGGRLGRGFIGALIAVVLVVATGAGMATGLGIAAGSREHAAPSATSEPPPLETPAPAPPVTPPPAPAPTVEPAPVPAPVPPVPPAPPAPPAPPVPPADTTAPTVQVSSSNATIYSANGSDTTIAALAQDDSGVVAASVSWTGWATGSATMGGAGSTWTFHFDPPPGSGTGQLTFVVTVSDAAGNMTSGSVVVAVQP